MTTTRITKSPEPRVAPVRGRSRANAAWITLLLFVTGGVAWAKEDEKEKYPERRDADVEKFVDAWKEKIAGTSEALCTGGVTRSGDESTRDPIDSTPNVPSSTPLDHPRSDGFGQIEDHRGGDTNAGEDSFLYVKLVGTKANLFCRVILEAEDGAKSEWRVRYKGTDKAVYTNGPAVRADTLSASNPWSIGWTRRIVDFDARDNECDEEKTVVQKFRVRLELIDGTVVGEGQEFQRSVPAGASATTSVGLSAKVGLKVADGATPEVGIEAGFTFGTTKTYDTKFTELVDSGGSAGVARWDGSAPCPFGHTWDVTTSFEGDFSIRDREAFTGSQGARQEFSLTVTNAIADIRAEGCHDCAAPPIRPTTPAHPPTPTAPTDPNSPGRAPTPTTPSDPSRPVTPSDPARPSGSTPTPPPGSVPGPISGGTDDPMEPLLPWCGNGRGTLGGPPSSVPTSLPGGEMPPPSRPCGGNVCPSPEGPVPPTSGGVTGPAPASGSGGPPTTGATPAPTSGECPNAGR